MKGNYLRLPVYRVKVVRKGDEEKSIKDTNLLQKGKPTLTSSVNFANRGSTQASWQVDDHFDPMTNGNYTRTEMTQTNAEWRDYSKGKPPKIATSYSCVTLSK